MYGNFTSNFFKLNFTQKIFKYSIDLSPEISDNSYDFLNTLEKKIKNNLNFPCLIKRRTLYSNQMLPPDITTTIESENVKYIVTIIQTSNIFLTDKIEQKEFLKLLFSEYMEDLKYFKFKKAYYNPFEVYDDKSLKIWRWNGFSIHISQFFNEFSLEITPKNLIFQKENCQELLKKIEELQPGIRKSQSNLKSLFRGHAIKARCFPAPNFFEIIDIIFPGKNQKKEIMTQEENGSNQGEEEIFFELVSLKLDGRKTYGYNTEINKPILLSLKNCNLLGYFDERRIITNYRDTCSNVYRQINHFLVILTRNQNIKRLFFDWKINLVSNPTCFQLFKIDSSQIILSNFLKNLNLISYGLNSFQFEEQYKAIFNEAPLLNFPSLENWVFFLHSDYVELGDLILNYLHMIVKKFGYSVEKPKCILLDSVVADDWIPKIYENLTKSHKFCIVMIPYMTNNIDFYEKLKTLITGEIGVPCQFFQAQTLEMNKENDCFYLRLLSQIAAKLGVAPWALKDLSFSKVPTLAIGVNITCGDENKLIISVVGSMNKDFSKYLSIFSVLKDRNSYINEINQLVLNLLEKFFLVHNLYPQNLIIFRDGEFIEFCDEEKEVLNKNINDLKNKQKIQTFDLQLIYIKVKLSNKQNILAVEKINQMYQKKISNPYFGSIFKTSEEYNKFYIYLHRNDNDLEIMYPTQFDVTIFSKSLATKDFLIYLQTFCLQLVFLNFSFSSRTSCPAPLQYAYKLGKFIEIIERNKDKRNGEHDIINIKENLTDLSSKGKLYFI